MPVSNFNPYDFVYPIGNVSLVGFVTYEVQQDFLDMFGRLYPPSYLQPLIQVGPGYEVLQCYAKIGERVSLAIARFEQGAYIMLAPDGALATGSIQLYRDSTVSSAILPVVTTAVSFTAPNQHNQQTITGLKDSTGLGGDFIQSYVGFVLQLFTGDQAGNQGNFTVLAVIDDQTVVVQNANGVAEQNVQVEWCLNTSVIVKAGTVVRSSGQGCDFLTTQDCTFGVNDLGPFTVPIVASDFGYEWNLPGELTLEDGTVLPGEIDTIQYLLTVPPYGDPTIQVAQPTATTGGAAAMLDQQGHDRGIDRGQYESADAYRARIRSLPDTVTPDAINRSLARVFDVYGAQAQMIETFEQSFQQAWLDLDSIGVSSIPTDNGFVPNVLCYDDPRPGMQDRWLDEGTARGCFIVVIPSIASAFDQGIAYDDPGVLATDFVTPNGQRAIPAYDVTSVNFQGTADGEDWVWQGVVGRLNQHLQQIKPAGVVTILERAGQ